MITQLLLDLLATLMASFISVLPPLPPEVATAVGSAASSAAALAPSLATLGPVVPFDSVNVALGFFPVAVGYWLTVSALRVVLWLVDR